MGFLLKMATTSAAVNLGLIFFCVLGSSFGSNQLSPPFESIVLQLDFLEALTWTEINEYGSSARLVRGVLNKSLLILIRF